MPSRSRFFLLLVLWTVILSACGAAPPDLLLTPRPPPPAETAPAPAAAAATSPAPPLAVATTPPSSTPPGNLSAFPVFTDPGEIPRLKVASSAAKDPGKELPLERTSVKARLAGFVAEVEVAQTYQNPYGAPIEAQYVFPLPENSAVHHMRMVIGNRVIEATIKQREEARRTYEAAKQAGFTAALLEQERPNVFTQSVANIEPGKKIDVIVRYVQDLTYDAGQYEFVFPMVVGPRFIQGEPLDRPPSGSGTYQDTAMVPDASRITPPIYGRGERNGQDISIEVVASAGLAIGDFSVPTHEVVSSRRPDGTFRLTLAEKKSIPNRDFVLRYRVAGEKPRATLLTSGKGEGFFSLVIHPPSLDIEDMVGRREILFVVDISGSMKGAPLALCKSAMREALLGLRPVDTFNIITFAGATGKSFERPRPANAANIREGLAFIEAQRAGGGTHMLDAVAASLSPEIEPGRHRYVFFLTDGYVAIEARILAETRGFISAIEARGQRAKVFGFGVGSSPNRNLLEGIAREGKGLTVYATSREDPARAVNAFYRYIDRSVLRDVKLDFGDLAVTEVFPRELPDLFASHALVVHGRYRGAAAKPMKVRAAFAGGEIDLPITVDAAPADDTREVLGTLWARAKVGWLEGGLWDESTRADAQQQITKLGIDFHLVTAFTSFVAVDLSKKVGDGAPTTVVQPVETPEGVDAEAAGARTMETQARARILSESAVSAQDAPPGLNAPPEPSPASPGGAEEMAVDRGARGCFCRAGDPAPAGWPPLVAALGMLALFGRRARRVRASGARRGNR